MRAVRIGTICLLWLVSAAAWAHSVQVEGVRMWPAPDNTRLVFDLNGNVDHRLFVLKNPDRIVIDLKNARLAKPIGHFDFKGSLLTSIRTAPRHKTDLRVVLDLGGPVHPKSFLLQPNDQYGNRLVVDLFDAAKGGRQPVAKVLKNSRRDVIVAIDPGHGGEDPGATGPGGTHEKDVVLAIGRRLKALINAQPGMHAMMTRDGDYFVSLRGRVEKARKAKADLFIAIHADACPDPRAKGSSVYTLSRRGASSEQARLLAKKENDSDLVGGVSLDDKDNLLASVLLDLSQTATKEASTDVATRVLRDLDRVGRLHKSRVEQAGFRVLKAPDIPSLLVETAFITNPTEERKLRSSSYQERLAEAMLAGIKAHFHANPPPGTLLAEKADRTHAVTRGETLSAIAQHYRISVDALRHVNSIRGDLVQVGDILRIPTSSGS